MSSALGGLIDLVCADDEQRPVDALQDPGGDAAIVDAFNAARTVAGHGDEVGIFLFGRVDDCRRDRTVFNAETTLDTVAGDLFADAAQVVLSFFCQRLKLLVAQTGDGFELIFSLNLKAAPLAYAAAVE
ncbi:MAG: hypothetical protein P8169_13930 [Chloroflexota bacterium]